MPTAVFVAHNYINFLICKKISEQFDKVVFISDRHNVIKDVKSAFNIEVRDFSIFKWKSSLNFKHSYLTRKAIRNALQDVGEYEIFIPTMRNRVSQVLVYSPKCTQFSLVEEGFPGPYNTEKTLTQNLSKKEQTPHMRRLVTNALFMNKVTDFKYFHYHHPKFSGNTYAIHKDAFPENANQIIVKDVFPLVDVDDKDILVLPNLKNLENFLEHIKTIVEKEQLKYFKPHPSNPQKIISFFKELGLRQIMLPLEVIHHNSNSNFHMIIYHFPGSICHYTKEENLVKHYLPK